MNLFPIALWPYLFLHRTSCNRKQFISPSPIIVSFMSAILIVQQMRLTEWFGNGGSLYGQNHKIKKINYLMPSIRNVKKGPATTIKLFTFEITFFSWIMRVFAIKLVKTVYVSSTGNLRAQISRGLKGHHITPLPKGAWDKAHITSRVPLIDDLKVQGCDLKCLEKISRTWNTQLNVYALIYSRSSFVEDLNKRFDDGNVIWRAD